MILNRKKLVTHNRSFHADDVFACATLCLMLEKKKKRFKITRTRDEETIKNGDYVFDVGGIYDAETNRFDHHQKGGAGKHENGIEYSSFGLVWKKFGEFVSGNKEVADYIEQKIVLPIDAGDNGINLCESNFGNIFPYALDDILSFFRPTSLEKMDKDKCFLKALDWVKKILKREIKKANDQITIAKIIQDFYQKSKDKRLVIVDEPKVSRFEIWEALENFPEPLFAVYGDDADWSWSVVAIRKERNSYEIKKNLPKAWAGLNGEELQKITGVTDAIFCHRGLFLAGAKSKEGAVKLAELALSL